MLLFLFISRLQLLLPDHTVHKKGTIAHSYITVRWACSEAPPPLPRSTTLLHRRCGNVLPVHDGTLLPRYKAAARTHRQCQNDHVKFLRVVVSGGFSRKVLYACEACDAITANVACSEAPAGKDRCSMCSVALLPSCKVNGILNRSSRALQERLQPPFVCWTSCPRRP